MVIDECPDGRGNALETERRNFQAEVRGGDAHQPEAAAASVDPTSSGGDDTEDDDADGDDFQLVSNRKAYRPRPADDVRGEQRVVRPVVTVLVSPRTLRSKKKLAAKARKLRRKLKREGLDLVDGTSGDGSQAYDFVHVRDVARANVCSLTSDQQFGFYNVGRGIQTSIKELAELLLRLSGREDLGIQYEPAGQTFVTNRIGCPKAAKEDLGYEWTIDLEDGMKTLIDWRNTHKAEVDKRRRGVQG